MRKVIGYERNGRKDKARQEISENVGKMGEKFAYSTILHYLRETFCTWHANHSIELEKMYKSYMDEYQRKKREKIEKKREKWGKNEKDSAKKR